MRSVVLALMTAFLCSGAIAQTVATPLAPGKPAGIRKAELHETENTILIGMGVLGAAAAALLVARAKGPSSSTTSTSP